MSDQLLARPGSSDTFYNELDSIMSRKAAPEPPPKRGITEDIATHLAVGANKYLALPVAGITEMAGKATGIKSVENAGKTFGDNAESWIAQKEQEDPSQKFRDISSVGDAARWAGEQMLEFAPQVGVGLLTGGAGAAAGRAAAGGLARAGITSIEGMAGKKAVQAAVANTGRSLTAKELGILAADRAGTAGAIAATGAGSVAMESSTIYRDQKPEEKDMGRALLFGTAAGILDTAFPAYLMKKTGLTKIMPGMGKVSGEAEALTGKTALTGVQRVKDTAKVAGLGIGEETIQEGVQTVLENIGANKQVYSDEVNKAGGNFSAFLKIAAEKGISAAVHPEAWNDIIESMAAGGLIGGVMGGGSSAAGHISDVMQQRGQQPQIPTEEANAVNQQNQPAPEIITGADTRTDNILQDTSGIAADSIPESWPVDSGRDLGIAATPPAGAMTRAVNSILPDLPPISADMYSSFATKPYANAPEMQPEVAALPSAPSELEKAMAWKNQQVQSGKSHLMQGKGVSDASYEANMLAEYRKFTSTPLSNQQEKANGVRDTVPALQNQTSLDGSALPLPEMQANVSGHGSDISQSGGQVNGVSSVQQKINGPETQMPDMRKQAVTDHITALKQEKERLLSASSKGITGGLVYPPEVTRRLGEINVEIQKLQASPEPGIKYAVRPDGTLKNKNEYSAEEWKSYTDSVIAEKLQVQQAAFTTAKLPEKPANTRRQLDTSKDSLAVAIAKLGGVSRADIDKQSGNGKDLAHTLNSMATKEAKAGILHVISSKGIPLDRMREALVEQGYLDESADINTLLDKLDSASRGQVHRSNQSADYGADAYREAEIRYSEMINAMTDEEYEGFSRNQWLDEQVQELADAGDILDEYLDELDNETMTAADWQEVENNFREVFDGTESSKESGREDKKAVQRDDTGEAIGVSQVSSSVAPVEDAPATGAGVKLQNVARQKHLAKLKAEMLAVKEPKARKVLQNRIAKMKERTGVTDETPAAPKTIEDEINSMSLDEMAAMFDDVTAAEKPVRSLSKAKKHEAFLKQVISKAKPENKPRIQKALQKHKAKQEERKSTPPPVGSQSVKPERDDQATPYFKEGDRVQDNDGKHGEVSRAETFISRMITYGAVSSEASQRHSHSYDVVWDNGVKGYASFDHMNHETDPAPAVVPAPVYNKVAVEPDALLRNVAYSRKQAQSSRNAAERAKKKENIASHEKSAAAFDKTADEQQAAFDTWAEKHPDEADKYRQKVEASKPKVEPVAGMKVSFNSAQNGIELRFDGKPSDSVINQIKAQGFRWAMRKRVWYVTDTPARRKFVEGLQGDTVTPVKVELADNEVQVDGNPYIYSKVDADWYHRSVGSAAPGNKFSPPFDFLDKLNTALAGKSFVEEETDATPEQEQATSPDYEAWWDNELTHAGRLSITQDMAGPTAALAKVKWRHLAEDRQKYLMDRIYGTGNDPIVSGAYKPEYQHYLEPKTDNRGASDILKAAADSGVKGAGEALKGLFDIFGGSSLKSFPGAVDEETYSKAKPHFVAAYNNFKESGKQLTEFFQFIAKQFGNAIKPYLMRFMDDVKNNNYAIIEENEEVSDVNSERQKTGTDDRVVDEGTGTSDVQGSETSRDIADIPGRVRSGDGGVVSVSVSSSINENQQEPGLYATGRGDGTSTTRDLGSDPSGISGILRPDAAGDLRIPNGGLERTGSWKDSASRNLDIVELIKTLREENRMATPDEQLLLMKYVGWGAGEIRNKIFPGYADHGKIIPNWAEASWRPLVDRLDTALTPEELKTAARSSQYAHYTSEAITRSMWKAFERMGFAGGKVFEPGPGTGNFMGTMPDGIYANSKYTGIEMDGITAAIAQQLYPNQNIIHGDYTKQKFPGNFFDVAIGNPPFSSTTILTDPDYKKNKFSLHDFFFAKTIDKVRPGGLLAFVTSRYTMDKLDDKARAYLSERADLLGAIRLPQTAFKQHSGTEVVTDVIFLRKRSDGAEAGGHAWGKTADIQIGDQTKQINEYFAAHPEMVLGTHVTERGQFSQNDYSVKPLEGDIGQLFASAVQNLPANVYSAMRQDPKTIKQVVIERDFSPKNKKEGGVYLSDKGEIMRVENGSGVSLSSMVKLSAKEQTWLTDYIPLRDLMKQARFDQFNDAGWEKSLKELNKAYDAFVKKHGQIKDFTLKVKTELDEDGNEQKVESRNYKWEKTANIDVEGSLVLALEQINDDGDISKASFLTGRTVMKPVRSTNPQSMGDALALSLDEIGMLDLDHIAGLMKMSRPEAIEALGDMIYETPSGEHLLADEYLSGDVVTKLAEAEQAARSDEKFQANVKALTEVQPKPLTPGQITAGLGMAWIPTDIVGEFAQEVLNLNIKVERHAATNTWKVTMGNAPAKGYGRRSSSKKQGVQSLRSSTAEWGTADRGANEILDAVLNQRPLRITVKDLDGKVSADPAATARVNEIADNMRTEFRSWIWTDAERAGEMLDLYNKKYNNLAPRRFDGSHLTLPGIATKYKLHPHQKRAIWRMIQTGNTYLAHAVGAGKAQPLDAKILTPSGWTRMGLVKIGDEVIAGDGSVTKITGVFPQGDKEIFKVTMSDGSSTECCDEHLWLTQNYIERGYSQKQKLVEKVWGCAQPKVRQLSEIRESLTDPRLGTKNHSIPVVGRVEFSTSSLPLDPYLLGVLLGDGSMSADHVCISSGDQQIIDICTPLLPTDTCFNKKKESDKCPTWQIARTHQKGYGKDKEANPVVGSLRILGLQGTKSYDKFVPECYKLNSTENRIALLQGLLDTDGSVSKRGHSIYFYTVSPQLAEDVTFLVQSLGGTVNHKTKRPFYVHNNERKEGALCHVLCLCLPPELMPFRLKRKIELVKPKTSHQPVRYIVSAESTGVKAAQCISVEHPSRLYVTDDFIVTHNTLEMIAAGMEMKRLGLINKPLYVVPNDQLSQWSAEFMDAYPLANIMVADELNFDLKNRKRFMAQAAMNAPDAIIITQSALGKLRMKPESVAPVKEKMLNAMREALTEARDDDAPRHLISKMEKMIENAEQRFDSIVEDGKGDNIITYEELGVDFLFVDEAHKFRKLDFTTVQQVKGIDPVGSRTALDLFLKTNWMEHQKPGRSHVFASGTPVTNTMGELYNVMRFFMEEEMERDDIGHFDSWAAMFGQMAMDYELNAAGKYEPVSRFAKFNNLPELMKRVRTFMDVLTSSHLGAYVVRPDIKGGKPNMIIATPSDELKAYQTNVLQPRMQRARDWKPTPDQPGNPDPIINIITDGRLSSIDMRLVGSTKNDPDSKLNRVINEIIRVYKDTKNVKYNGVDGKPSAIKGGTQVVFYNHGFGANVAKSRGFDARAWINQRLKAAGIPAGEVAWFDEYDTSAKQLSVMKDMREGRKKIIIGHANSLGVGKNLQTRLYALHYIDPPWYPSAVEQAHGRIIRQGNQNTEIEANWYSTKGSYDSTMWQMVGRKGRFIEQAFMGDDNLRTMEDVSEVSQYEMARALSSGDERVIKLVGLQADIERYSRLKEAHFQQQSQMRGDKNTAEWNITTYKKHIAKLKEAVKAVGGYVSGSNFKGIVGKRTFDRAGEFGEAVVTAYNQAVMGLQNQFPDDGYKGVWTDSQQYGTINGMPLVATVAMSAVTTQYSNIVQITDNVPSEIDTNMMMYPQGTDGAGLARRVFNRLNDVSDSLRRTESNLAEDETKLKQLVKRIGAPFEHEAAFNDKIAELSQLQAELTADEAKHGEGTANFALGDMHADYPYTGRESIDPIKNVDHKSLVPQYIAQVSGLMKAADYTLKSITSTHGYVEMQVFDKTGKHVLTANRNFYKDWVGLSEISGKILLPNGEYTSEGAASKFYDAEAKFLKDHAYTVKSLFVHEATVHLFNKHYTIPGKRIKFGDYVTLYLPESRNVIIYSNSDKAVMDSLRSEAETRMKESDNEIAGFTEEQLWAVDNYNPVTIRINTGVSRSDASGNQALYAWSGSGIREKVRNKSSLVSSEVQTFVDTLPIAKRVKVWQSPTDLQASDPAAYNQIEVANVDPARVQAMEFGGTIHVITDNVPDMQRIKALVIGHELAHAGQTKKVVDLAVDWFKRTVNGKTEAAKEAHFMLKRIADRYGYDLTDEKQYRRAVQEATAAIAEQAVNADWKPLGLMQRLFMYIKHWLRQQGLISHVSDSELSLAVAEMLRIGEKRLSVGNSEDEKLSTEDNNDDASFSLNDRAISQHAAKINAPAKVTDMVKSLIEMAGQSIPERLKANIGKILSNPWFGSEGKPIRRHVVNLNLERSQNRNGIISDLFQASEGYTGVEGLDNILKKASKEELKQFNELIKHGDENGVATYFTRDELYRGKTKFGKVGKTVVEAYRAFHEVMNAANRVRFQQLDELSLLPYKDQEWFADLVELLNKNMERAAHLDAKEANDAYRLIRSLKRNLTDDELASGENPAKIKASPAVIAAYRDFWKQVDQTEKKHQGNMLSAFRDILGYRGELDKLKSEWGNLRGYAPRNRKDGDWHVSVYTTNEEGERVKVYMKPTLTETGAKGLVREVQADLKKHLKGNFQAGTKYEVEYERNNATPSELLAWKGSEVAVEALLNQAFDRAGVTGKMSVEQWQSLKHEVFQEIAKEIMAQGFGRHGISREANMIEGYDDADYQTVLKEYISGMSGWLSKMRFSIEATNAAKDISKADPSDKVWVNDYVQDAMKNSTYLDELAATARSVGAVYYLGFKVSSALLNAFQNYTVGQAELSLMMKKAGHKGSGIAALAKAQKDVMADFINIKNGGAGTLTKEERDVLFRAVREGTAQAQAIRQISGTQEMGFGTGWKKFTELSMTPFAFVEQRLNREPAILAAYRIFKKSAAGAIDEAAYKQAETFVNNTHYVMGKENLPEMVRKLGPLGKTAYLFQGYVHNYMHWMFNRAKDGEFATIARSLGAIAALGGVFALPGADDMDNWIMKWFGVSYKMKFKKFVKDTAGNSTPGQIIQNFVNHGVTSVAGVDMSRALAVNIPFISDPEKTFGERIGGAWGGLLKKPGMALNAANKGDYVRAVENLLPEFAANPMRAARQYNQGATTMAGKPIFDETGRQVKYSGTDVAKKMLGFNPLEISDRTNLKSDERDLNAYWKSERDDALAGIRRAKNSEDMKAAVRGVIKYNTELRKSQAFGLVPIIKAESIQKSRTFKPQKKTMAWERNQIE